jgi:4-amino-4-deoxy-L-arabinose transferase-like glycosyltransferase
MMGGTPGENGSATVASRKGSSAAASKAWTWLRERRWVVEGPPLAAGIAATTLLALVIRVASVDTVLPHIHHSDEPWNVAVSLRVARAPTKSPGFFNYPSFLFYTQAAVARGYEAVTGTRVEPAQAASGGNAFTGQPGFWRLGRLTSVAFGCGIVALVTAATKWITGSPWVAILAGVWAALSPLLVENSRYITPDIYAAFFTMAAVAAALKLSRAWHYALAGALVGLAAGSKYNLALAALPIAVAHFARTRLRGLYDWRILLAAFAAVAFFLLATPFALLDYRKFRGDLLSEVAHYRTGHSADSSSYFATLRWLWEDQRYLLAFVPFAFLGRDRALRKAALVVASFVVGYTALLSSLTMQVPRNLPALIGPVVVLAGAGFKNLVEAIRRRSSDRRIAIAFVVATLALSLRPVPELLDAIRARRFNPRLSAARWIAEHVPKGSHVLVESYGPWVDPRAYKVTGVWSLAGLSRPELGRRGVRYLVLTELAHARFLADPGRYPGVVRVYQELFRDSCELARFNERSQDEIRVLELGCSPKRNGT